MALTAEQDAYLREHTLAVLGTGRGDGSPQLSMIIYDYDGTDAVISVTSDRAKWKNAMRQPNVALLVPDGRRQLIVYGTVEGIADTEARNAGTRRIRARMGREVTVTDAELTTELDGANRVILRLTPDRAFMND
ncbi:MAG: pyridoxamine 5'-phosphate oxidase family protein [Chloroflexi bacterium]|nr:pyridoxamine 5'-phosphate oxidase family protein [Chloroflexota bacterium]MDA1145694.1 pyridoxamine 5'-phosphate oxidase family protein [Chloroflexota bacterium]